MKLSHLFLILIAIEANAFEYFDSKIDYWNETPDTQKTVVKKTDKKKVKAKNSKKFSWNEQLDPKNDEFFKEGDYTPPAAFMELVRNPTDKNIQNWFKLIKKKNDLSTRLSKRMGEYLAKNNSSMKPEGVQYLKATKKIVTPFKHDPQKYRFRMYFDSKCPHCKRMMATLKDIQSMGYYVELKQLDTDRRSLGPIPFPVTQASNSELDEKDIRSVPVLFIGDLENKLVYRLNGYKSTSAVFTALRNSKNAIKAN